MNRPILFSTPMVRAILNGNKTQTRRIIKHQLCTTVIPYKHPDGYWMWQEKSKEQYFQVKNIRCLYGVIGDTLWVREAWKKSEKGGYIYKADYEKHSQGGNWKPSIHMPREASRILLEVLNVKIERLQDITEEDAKLEGITPIKYPSGWNKYTIQMPLASYNAPTAKQVFEMVWEAIYGEGSWDENPWVWVISFKRI